jgi:hypothetical protein
MLFVVDTSSKQPAVSDGSYRVKRVCMDPTINRSFGAKCPFFSPSKVWVVCIIGLFSIYFLRIVLCCTYFLVLFVFVLFAFQVISNVVDVDSDDDFYGTDDAHAKHEIC